MCCFSPPWNAGVGEHHTSPGIVFSRWDVADYEAIVSIFLLGLVTSVRKDEATRSQHSLARAVSGANG